MSGSLRQVSNIKIVLNLFLFFKLKDRKVMAGREVTKLTCTK